MKARKRTRRRERPWRKVEKNALRSRYPALGAEALAKEFGRSIRTVASLAAILGLERVTARELSCAELIDVQSAGKAGANDLAVELRVPISTIHEAIAAGKASGAPISITQRTGRAWRQAELDSLRADVPAIGPRACARKLGRPLHEVVEQAAALGIVSKSVDRTRRSRAKKRGEPLVSAAPRRGRATQWTIGEDAILRARVAIEGPVALAQHPALKARTAKAIALRAARLNLSYVAPEVPPESSTPRQSVQALTKRRPQVERPKRVVQSWTQEDDDQLCALYLTLKPREVAERMGRTYAAVTNRATGLGITAAQRAYTHEEDEFLRAEFGKLSLTELGERLGRPPRSCEARAYLLGLRARSAAA